MTLNRLEVKTKTNVSDEQIAENVRSALARGLNAWSHRPCVIVGGGPSLKRNERLPDYPVFGLNNAAWYHPCDYVVMMDARPENAEMDIVSKSNGEYFILASQVHPNVFDAILKNESHVVEVWHAAGSKVLKELGIKGVGGGGTVLTRVVPLAYEMGFRQFHLYGVDSSYSDDGRHHAYDQPLNDGAETIEVFTPHKQTRFVTTGALAEQAQQCMDMWQSFESLGCEFHIYGEGLLPTLWREAKEAKADLDTSEPAKYRQMWSNPNYRRWSPGEDMLPRIMAELGMPQYGNERRVNDYGCGTGRAAKRLAESGYVVNAFDFADNCLDSTKDLPFNFFVANLWDLPRMLPADYGICTDVMEHIPPEKVDAVLANIAASSKQVAFTISFQPDRFGATIGKPLHLTIKPPDWWHRKLSDHFATVAYKGDGLFVCTKG